MVNLNNVSVPQCETTGPFEATQEKSQSTTWEARTVTTPVAEPITTVSTDFAVKYLMNLGYEIPDPSNCTKLCKTNDNLETFMGDLEKKLGKFGEATDERSKVEKLIKAAGFLRKQQPASEDLDAVDAYAVAAELSIAEWNTRFIALLPPVINLSHFVRQVDEMKAFCTANGYTALAATLSEFQAVKEKHGGLLTHAFAAEWNPLASKFESQYSLLIRLRGAEDEFTSAYQQFIDSIFSKSPEDDRYAARIRQFFDKWMKGEPKEEELKKITEFEQSLDHDIVASKKQKSTLSTPDEIRVFIQQYESLAERVKAFSVPNPIFEKSKEAETSGG